VKEHGRSNVVIVDQLATTTSYRRGKVMQNESTIISNSSTASLVHSASTMLLNSTLSPHSSTITESSRTEAELNLWQQSLIGCFLSITTIISIFGNVLVCVAILTHR